MLRTSVQKYCASVQGSRALNLEECSVSGQPHEYRSAIESAPKFSGDYSSGEYPLAAILIARKAESVVNISGGGVIDSEHR